MNTRLERVLQSSVAIVALGAVFALTASPASAQLGPLTSRNSQPSVPLSPRVFLQLPDLVIESWTIGWSNNHAAVFVKVKNVGSAAALLPSIALVRANVGSVYVAVPPLAPGQSSALLPAEFPNIIPTGNVYFEADVTKNIVELVEFNNALWDYIDGTRWF